MERLPSGNYRERIRYKDRDGKTKQKSFTGPTKRAVKDQIKEWEMAEEERRANEPEPGSMTVREAVEEYIRVKEPVLSPATIAGYLRYIRCYFNEENDFSGMQTSTLTQKDVQQFVADLALEHSPKTVRNVYALFTAAIDMANPEKHFRITLPTKRPVKRTVPTDAQVKELLDAADPELRKAIILGSFSLRRGEVCALKRSDIYPDLCLIHVHADMVLNKNGSYVYKDIPKTSSSIRSIRIPKEVLTVLLEGSSEYVVQLKPSQVTDRFSVLRDRLGIDVTFHSLRRYCASVLHAMGMPDKYIQQIGGWSSPDIMRRCYEQVLEDKAVELSKKMTDYYSEKFSDSYEGGAEQQA